MTKNILLLFSVISKALIILYIISSACKYSLYLVAFPMRNIKAFYSYHNYKECNIHILIMPLTRISKHRINFPNRWNEADAQSSFWNGCYHNFHFLQRSFFFCHTHKDKLNISVLPGGQEAPITEWGWSGSAGSDPIGHRCCCCGGERLHTAAGRETAAGFLGVLQHGMCWRRWCPPELRGRWTSCQLWRAWEKE